MRRSLFTASAEILTFGKSGPAAPGTGAEFVPGCPAPPPAQVDGPATRWAPNRASKVLGCELDVCCVWPVGGVCAELVPDCEPRALPGPLVVATIPLPGLS